MNDASDTFDVAVVGGGPAGLAAAIALAQAGAKTALIARRAPYADNRTTALLGGSVDFLQAAGCLAALPGQGGAAAGDAAGRRYRPPDPRARGAVFVPTKSVSTSSATTSKTAFWSRRWKQRAAELAELTRFDDEAEPVSPGRADGRHSHRPAENRSPRGWSSAPTAGIRCAARPPASRSRGAISIRRR